jgi:hypothetical protein
MRSSLISAIVAGSLLLSTTAASAQQPGPIPARSGSEVEDADQIVGTFMIIGLVAVLAVVGFFVVLDDDDDEPTSP